MNAVNFFCLHKLPPRIRSGAVLMALEIHQCAEMHWCKTATREQLVTHDSRTVDVIKLD